MRLGMRTKIYSTLMRIPANQTDKLLSGDSNQHITPLTWLLNDRLQRFTHYSSWPTFQPHDHTGELMIQSLPIPSLTKAEIPRRTDNRHHWDFPVLGTTSKSICLQQKTSRCTTRFLSLYASTCSMIDPKDLRDWLFRGLMFESEAERFRAAGIRVGSNVQDSERQLFEEQLTPFGIDLRGEALRMARLYAFLYCFENSVRELVTQRLRERHGEDWWATKVPRKVQEFATARQQDAKDNSWLEGSTKDPLSFVQFGHLTDII